MRNIQQILILLVRRSRLARACSSSLIAFLASLYLSPKVFMNENGAPIESGQSELPSSSMRLIS